MTKPARDEIAREETPVDDVRRIREQLSREAGGDIQKLIEQSQRFFEEYREKLGLKLVSPPKSAKPRSDEKT